MALNRNAPVVRDTWLVDSPSGSGNGQGDYLEVGKATYANRIVFAADFDFTGALSVGRAAFSFVATKGCLVAMGSAPKFFLERVPSGYGANKEGDIGGNCDYNSSNATVFPGPDSLTANRAYFAASPAEGARIELVCTAMVEAIRQELAADGKVKGTFVFRLIAANSTANGYEENNTARYIAMYSRHTTKPPRIEMVLEDNRRPNAPAYLLRSVSGDRVTWQLTRNDPDEADFLDSSDAEYWTEGTQDDVDAEGSGVIVGGTGTKITGSERGGIVNHYFDGIKLTTVERTDYYFTPGDNLRVRFRTRDKAGVWGKWGRLRDPLLFSSIPAAPYPDDLTVTTDSLTPDYGGTMDNRAQPTDVLSGVEIQVRRVTQQGTLLLWNASSETGGTGKVPVPGGTIFLVTHGGETLTYGEEVERRIRVVNQYGVVGLWSNWLKWTPQEPDKPILVPPIGSRLDSLQPELGARYSEPFDGLHLRVYGSLTGDDLLWDSEEYTIGDTSSFVMAYNLGGTLAIALSWGQRIYPEARVRLASFASAGNWTPWSDRGEYRLNVLSRAIETQVQGAIVSPHDGRFVVMNRTPRLILPRNDPDANDPPTRRVIEVWAHPRGASPVHTHDISSGITDVYDVPSGVWAWEQDRELRHRYAGQEGVLGAFGSFVVLGASQPPVVTQGDPIPDPNPDPTPRVDWVTVSPSGKPIVRAEVPFYLALPGDLPGDEMHRGRVEGDTSEYVPPDDLLKHGLRYVVIPRAFDRDGLYGDLSDTALGTAIAAIAGAGEATMLTTLSTATPSDIYTRTVTDGWGTATVGGAWTVISGSVVYFDVDGARGTLIIPVANAQYVARLGDVSMRDVTATVKARTDKLAVGANSAALVFLRFVDASNYYFCWLVFKTDGSLELAVRKYVGGSLTTISHVTIPGTHVVATDYTIKFQVAGIGPTALRAKAWRTSEAEPGSWQIDNTTDSTAALQVAAAIGLGARLNSGTSNTPVTFSFDDLATS